MGHGGGTVILQFVTVLIEKYSKIGSIFKKITKIGFEIFRAPFFFGSGVLYNPPNFAGQSPVNLKYFEKLITKRHMFSIFYYLNLSFYFN